MLKFELLQEEAFKLEVNDIEPGLQPLSLEEIESFIKDSLAPTLKDPDDVIERHFGVTYTYLNDLIESMTFIASKWPNLSDDEKEMIASKMEERSTECTPGFHNGLQECIRFLNKRESLSFYLQVIREDLVKKAAVFLRSDDTHAHEAVNVAAAIRGYGVRANINDVYASQFTQKGTTEVLGIIFRNNFRPLQIIGTLLRNIESHLRESCGYEGRKPEGQTYEQGQYLESWPGFLKAFFGADVLQEVDFQKWMIADDEFNVVDLNWPKVKSTLISELSKRYFDLSDNQQKLLLSLTGPGKNIDITSFFNEKLINKLDDLESFVELYDGDLSSHASKLLEGLSEQTRMVLLNDLEHLPNIKRCISKDAWEEALKDITDEAIMDYCDHQLERLVKFLPYKSSLAETLVKKHGPVDLDTLIRLPSEAMMPIFNAMSEADREGISKELCEVTDNGFTILMRAVVSSPESIGPVLSFLRMIHPEKVSELTLSKCSIGLNTLMYAVVNKDHGATKLLLDAIAKYALDELPELILMANDINCETALMIAAGKDPVSVEVILDAMNKHAPDKLAEYLLKTNEDGETALMIAAGNNPESAKMMLDIMAEYVPNELAECLLKANDKGETPFMIAATSCPDLAMHMLEIMTKVSPSKLARLQLKADKRGMTALMVAAYLNPELMTDMLDAMTNTAPDELHDLLLKTNFHNVTALMIAASSPHPDSVKLLLGAITNTAPDELYNLLLKTANAGETTLMCAASSQCPESVKHILDAMEKTCPNELRGHLLEANAAGDTALIIAVRKNPEAVELVLNAMKNTAPNELPALLSKTNARGETALMLALKKSPQATQPIINASAEEAMSTLASLIMNENKPICLDIIAEALSMLPPVQLAELLFSPQNNAVTLYQKAKQIWGAEFDYIYDGITGETRQEISLLLAKAITDYSSHGSAPNCSFFTHNDQHKKFIKELADQITKDDAGPSWQELSDKILAYAEGASISPSEEFSRIHQMAEIIKKSLPNNDDVDDFLLSSWSPMGAV